MRDGEAPEAVFVPCRLGKPQTLFSFLVGVTDSPCCEPRRRGFRSGFSACYSTIYIAIDALEHLGSKPSTPTPSVCRPFMPKVEDVGCDVFNGAGGAALRLPMFHLEGIVLFPGPKISLRDLQNRFAKLNNIMRPLRALLPKRGSVQTAEVGDYPGKLRMMMREASSDNEKEPPSLPLERMLHGFCQYMVKRQGKCDINPPFFIATTFDLMFEITLAMEYVYSFLIQHRDPKAGNILVRYVKKVIFDPVRQVHERGYLCKKLADFGLVKSMVEVAADYRMKRNVGITSYMPPELFGANANSHALSYPTKADIYSFALGLDKVNVNTKLKGEPGTALEAEDEEALYMAQLISRHPSSFLMEMKAATESFILNAGLVDSDNTLPVEATRAEVDMLFKFHEFEPARKRIRIRPWSADETRASLELLEEVSRVDAVPAVWDYVSDHLWDQYGFDRSPNSCENMWATLLQSLNDTQSHDDDFTNLEWECRELIGRIVSRKPNFEHCRSSTWMDGGGFYSYSPPSLMIWPSQPSAGDEASDDDGDDEMGSIDDEGFSGDSTSTIESQADSVLTADIHSHGVSRITDPGCYETSSTYADRKRSAADAALEDEIISRIAPLVKQQIEAALKPLLSAFRSRVVK